MMSMRVIVLALAMVLCTERFALSGTFSDAFSTNPFSLPRWCERWHHVHWDSINQLMSGVNGTSCAGSSCCQTICPLDGCVNTNIGGHFLITQLDYTGTVRSAKADFGLQSPLSQPNGEHVAMFAVSHPKCHVGYEATVFREPAGTYQLLIFRVASPATAQNPECDDFAGTNSGAIVGLTLATSTLPRYNLKLTTQPSGATLIFSQATLKDNQTGVTLATIGWYSDYPTTWYNTTAKRFGFGGIRLPANGVIPFDNFVGTF